MAVRAGRRGARRRVPASSDVARRPRRPPPRGDRPRARRRGDLLDRREFAPAAVRRRGRTGPPGVGDERPAAHHRRRPRRRRRQPAPRCTTSPGRRATSGCASCSPSTGAADRHAGRDASEPDRPARRDRARARTRSATRRHRDARPPPRRRTVAPNWSSGSPHSVGGFRSRSTSSPAEPPTSRGGCRRSTPT